MNKPIRIITIALLSLFAVSLLTARLRAKVKIASNNNLALEQLRSLPYLFYSEQKVDKAKIGVMRYDRQKTYEGYNLDITAGRLMDMDGNVIHRWKNKDFIRLLDNGDIIGTHFNKNIDDNRAVGKYTWDDNLIWKREDIIMHHEIALTPNNTILVATKELVTYNQRKVIFDVIVELDQSGKELSRWSTWKNFEHIRQFHALTRLDKMPKGTEPHDDWSQMWGGHYDYYHLNSIQVLPENPIGRKDKRFQKGNWLICLSQVNIIAILNKNTKKILWSWGIGEIEHPHMPRMLDNGTILIFDNGRGRKYSRVIELDPLKEEIVWEYKADPPESFFSKTLGSAQRLPNGNTLIAESAEGRVFEVTKEGETVWEWYSPGINKLGNRSVVYRMIRHPKDKIDKILENISSDNVRT